MTCKDTNLHTNCVKARRLESYLRDIAEETPPAQVIAESQPQAPIAEEPKALVVEPVAVAEPVEPTPTPYEQQAWDWSQQHEFWHLP